MTMQCVNFDCTFRLFSYLFRFTQLSLLFLLFTICLKRCIQATYHPALEVSLAPIGATTTEALVREEQLLLQIARWSFEFLYVRKMTFIWNSWTFYIMITTWKPWSQYYRSQSSYSLSYRRDDAVCHTFYFNYSLHNYSSLEALAVHCISGRICIEYASQVETMNHCNRISPSITIITIFRSNI